MSYHPAIVPISSVGSGFAVAHIECDFAFRFVPGLSSPFKLVMGLFSLPLLTCGLDADSVVSRSFSTLSTHSYPLTPVSSVPRVFVFDQVSETIFGQVHGTEYPMLRSACYHFLDESSSSYDSLSRNALLALRFQLFRTIGVRCWSPLCRIPSIDLFHNRSLLLARSVRFSVGLFCFGTPCFEAQLER